MNFITTNLQALTDLFALVALLAMLTAGFFLGRKWLNNAGEGTGASPSSGDNFTPKEMYGMWRSSGATPADMHKMRGGWRKL